MADYRLIYRNPQGIKLVDGLPFSAIDYYRTINDIGKLTITLPPNYLPGYFKKDAQFELWRSLDGSNYYLEGETTFLLRRPIYATSEAGERTIRLECYDMIDIMRRTIVSAKAHNAYSDKSGAADNIIKAIFRENRGSLAVDITRDQSVYITVQADLTLGAVVAREISKKVVLDVAKDVADASTASGTRIIFDIVRTGDNLWELRTYAGYRGIDHSATSTKPLIVSEDLGNLSSPEILVDYVDEANFVYANGKGDAEWALETTASDAARIGESIFSRAEGYAQNTNIVIPDTLTQLANSTLQQGRPRIQFNGRVLETPSTIYGLNYSYGDLITANYQGYSMNVRVDTVHITYDSQNGENLEIRLKGDFYA